MASKGDSHLQHYSIHFFDKLNIRFLIREWMGVDDFAALDHARKLSIMHAVEVWQGDRRVGRVNRAGAPLATEDRQCL